MYTYSGDVITNIYDVNGDVISSGSSETRYVTTKMQTAPNYKTVNNNLYRLVWADDFDGNDIDKNYWRDLYLVDRVTYRYLAWSDYYLKNSILHLRIKSDAPNRFPDYPSSGNRAMCSIQSGEANLLHMTDRSHHDINPFWGLLVQEGYWECRFKGFKAQSTAHFAWWIIGIQDGEFAQNPRAEIDIIETSATNTQQIPHGLHPNGDDTVGFFRTLTDIDVDLADDYHTVGFLWEGGRMNWYLDGELIDSNMRGSSPQYPMIMFLSLYKTITGATGTDGQPLGDVEFCVDYIKIWKKATTQSEVNVTVSGQNPISIDGTTQDLTIDVDRGCPICFPSYVYINWSDGTRTEHWVKWDSVKPTYSNFITNESTFSWHGFVYDLGIDAYATVTF